jgi:hypothetical protein
MGAILLSKKELPEEEAELPLPGETMLTYTDEDTVSDREPAGVY